MDIWKIYFQAQQEWSPAFPTNQGQSQPRKLQYDRRKWLNHIRQHMGEVYYPAGDKVRGCVEVAAVPKDRANQNTFERAQKTRLTLETWPQK